jgi:hypothetical protein
MLENSCCPRFNARNNAGYEYDNRAHPGDFKSFFEGDFKSPLNVNSMGRRLFQAGAPRRHI